MSKRMWIKRGVIRALLFTVTALAAIGVAQTCFLGLRLFGRPSNTSTQAADPKSGSALPGQDVFNGHKVVLDSQNKILPWVPQALLPTASQAQAGVPVLPAPAYDHFLRLRWDFIKTKVPNCPGPPPRSSYPQYYFYCAFWDNNGVLDPDTWMNDVGEKIPNWFESARLYYAHTGDATVMAIVKKLMDYTLAHGTSPASFAWPNFPYTTANAGDMEFRGFTKGKHFALNEVQVGYAGDIGLVYYRMYLYSGDEKYLTAALNVANTLSRAAGSIHSNPGAGDGLSSSGLPGRQRHA